MIYQQPLNRYKKASGQWISELIEILYYWLHCNAHREAMQTVLQKYKLHIKHLLWERRKKIIDNYSFNLHNWHWWNAKDTKYKYIFCIKKREDDKNLQNMSRL